MTPPLKAPLKALTGAPRVTLGACVTVAAGLLIAGCGSSGSATTSARQPVAQTTSASPVASTAGVVAAKPPSLRILSPSGGAHTGSTVTVHVSVRGAAPHGSGVLYVLDGHLSRHGSTRLTYRELAPGRHTLVATLTGDSHVRAVGSFLVRAPAPAPAPAPVPPAESAHSAPMGSEQAPASTQPASPPPASKPNPPAATGIPQGGGGDGDSDNNGAPSDGDGNL